MKNVLSFVSFLRYIGGIVLVLMGMLNFPSLSSIFIVLGVSLFPSVYVMLSKYFNNEFINYILPIMVPVILAFFTINILNVNEEKDIKDFARDNIFDTNVTEQMSDEEKLLKRINESLLSNESLDSYELNENNKYDIKIKNEGDKGDIYSCALNLQNFYKTVRNMPIINSVQFECTNKGVAFNFIKIKGNNLEFLDTSSKVLDITMDKLKEEHELKVINEFKKSSEEFTYKNVLRNPSDYKNKKAYWFGKIVQVVDKYSSYSIFRVDVTCEKYTYIDSYSCDDTIYVIYYGSDSFIEDDMVKMWGYMEGTETYTTVFGVSMTVPKFTAKYIELQ